MELVAWISLLAALAAGWVCLVSCRLILTFTTNGYERQAAAGLHPWDSTLNRSFRESKSGRMRRYSAFVHIPVKLMPVGPFRGGLPHEKAQGGTRLRGVPARSMRDAP